MHQYALECSTVRPFLRLRKVYDFIIFRGQDIKDLTVLEGQGKPSSVPLLHSHFGNLSCWVALYCVILKVEIQKHEMKMMMQHVMRSNEQHELVA